MGDTKGFTYTAKQNAQGHWYAIVNEMPEIKTQLFSGSDPSSKKKALKEIKKYLREILEADKHIEELEDSKDVQTEMQKAATHRRIAS